ncbi:MULTISPECIES: DUF2304 domain-containing protein [Microbacterium]|uniref:DUF2304 domain-containing protein n=1 Tax=Microbacterium TaxID=33882 RepID=UPI001E43DCB0|nr:DUF2304 domain-containing protein [Microbacterium nymphoidis]MCD2499736.1 DUF2304 domain-containing protein [Microbacterium nymphoidis]
MMISILGIIVSLGVIIPVMWMLLTRRLREKYAILWLLLGVVLLVLGLFPGLLERATRLLGVQLPVNLFFAAAIVVLIGVALHLSWELSQSENETRRLAEEVAILGARLDALEDRDRDASTDPTAPGS